MMVRVHKNALFSNAVFDIGLGSWFGIFRSATWKFYSFEILQHYAHRGFPGNIEITMFIDHIKMSQNQKP